MTNRIGTMPSPAPSHNIRHFCVRELGASSDAYPVIALRRFSEQVLTRRSLICSSIDAGVVYDQTA